MNILLEEQGSNLTAAQVAHCTFLLAVVNPSVIHPQGEIKSKRMGKRRKYPSDKKPHPVSSCLPFIKIKDLSICVLENFNRFYSLNQNLKSNS